MNEDFVLSVLAETKSLIEYGGVSRRYENNLSLLGMLLKETNCNDAKRDAFASEFLQPSTDILAGAFSFDTVSDTEIELYLRNVRGLVLFVRNLTVSTSAHLDLVSLLSSMRKLISNVERGQNYFTACLQAFLQVLANYCLNQRPDSISFSGDLVGTLDEPIVAFIQGEKKLDLSSPFNIFLSKYLLSRDNGAVVFMHGEHAHFMKYIFEEAFHQAHTDCFQSGLLPFFEKLVTEREFGYWLKKQDLSQFVTRVLTVCQLVVTNKQDWDSPKCVVMITWVFEVCKDLMETSVHLLQSKTSDDAALDQIHTQLVRALDILSDLCKFSIVPQYLRDLHAIDILIRLLRAAHENTEVKTSKLRKQAEDVYGNSSVRTMKSFPLVKSLVIEILAYLCHESFPTQEAMRELHGLELILSNCVIDEDNPYIKEHSVLCLRFVLQENQRNQEFIALLEAKQVVNADALSEAGYEVSIKDGKVKVRNSDSP
ncbi:ataxin-10 [Metschnikowia aff. pulcherrima]|uniref:Ataxin-10 homolog n=1 Tax=Metschnikowia aff. pulcherrima TaxID=2163413 RepID=A0A4P6XJK1_9ASCO|nr:ataxin-10 [Metschnikowia aff. pulcherrima]